MKDVGYVIAAYVGSGLLYGGYTLWLRARERRLEGKRRGVPR